ncbi:MAG: hypothetical protein ACK46O_09135 [Flavobacteriia bacterium]|jgi:hypothetical protein
MKRIITSIILSSVSVSGLMAQNVGIGTPTPNASAKLDITDANRGILIPRVALTSTTVAAPVTAPVVSLLIYNTSTAGVAPDNVTPGYYYWDGTKWARLLNTESTDWKLTGNAGTVAATNFIGTTDAIDFVTRTGNAERMRVTSTGNVGIGTATPSTKLHVSDPVSPNAASVRVSGLASTSTLTTNATDVMVMTDVNGVMRRSNEAVKDAWYTTGNATTALRSIGTTTNQPFQFISNNIARGRVSPTDGEFVWGAIASPYAGDALCAVSTFGTPFAINGYSNQNGSGTWGEILTGGTTNFSAVQGVYAGSGVGAGTMGNYAGTNVSTTRAGVYGVVTQAAANPGGAGVYGYNNIASGSQRMGVLGFYNGTAYGIGVHGLGFGGGIIAGNNDVAVVGWRANNANYSGYFNGNHVIANGTKSASVPTSQGNQLLYCMESPEVWFEDFGTAQLINGIAHVELDPLFLQTVLIDNDHPMHVFVQVQGECEDVYVVPGETGFTVKEKNSGSSSVTFSYRLVAKRLHFPDHRFGNDPVWGPGDTRQYSERAPKRPTDYNEMVRQDEEAKRNWKPSPSPAITYPEAPQQELSRDPGKR